MPPRSHAHPLRRLALVACAAAIAILNPASARNPGDTPDAPIHAVCTVAMVADIVQAVGGERVRADALIGAGVDPHLYKATRDDIAKLLGADIAFYNGLTLEGKMTDALVKVARSGKPVYAVAESIPESYLLEPEALQGHFDPHVWMDPVGWIHATDAVESALVERYPAFKAEFERRAETYRETLRRLDAYAEKALASIPSDRRVLVTSHDAFNYFGRRYGVEVLGIQGISTVAEAGLADIERIVAELVRRKVPAVFPETTVSDKNISALIEGAKGKGHAVVIGGRLFSDAMGAAGTYEGTYVGMIDHNVTTIVRALGGEAPAGGMQGRLAHGPN